MLRAGMRCLMALFCSRPIQFLLLLLLAALGAVCGAAAGRRFDTQEPARTLPLPHHIPKYPGVASLRFAMVHDVVTERFPKHGPAYYEERNRLAQQALTEEAARMKQGDGKPTKRYFELLDDRAAGLDLLRRHDEAIALMRQKLKQQQDLNLPPEELYSSYANLGTFIILAQIHEGFDDKKKAQATLTEGVGLIHDAIKINPKSHFGREIWQAVILEYLLALLDDPELVLKYDMVGNALAAPLPAGARSRSPLPGWSHMGVTAAAILDTVDNQGQRDHLREFIQRVGAEPGWNDAVQTAHNRPVPFDEPTLGIIGMWRLGGGANPFFAIALGEIMIRVGQHYLAWNAYERASRLADGIGPDPIPRKFKEHCQARQQAIEAGLPAPEVAQLRPSFEKHLQQGQDYQKAYQEYEARRIKEGASIADPHFYAAFDAQHGSIASPIGEEDRLEVEPRPVLGLTRTTVALACLGAGLLAFMGALFFRVLNRTMPPATALP